MGLGLDKFFGTILPIAGGALGSIFGAPMVGAAIGGAAASLLGHDLPIGGGGAPAPAHPGHTMFGPPPAILAPGSTWQPGSGVDIPWTAMPAVWEGGDVDVTPVALPAVVGGALRITARLASALARVAARLGFGALTATTVVRFGGRLYRSLTAFARRHPGISILSMLASLGMTAQEAAEFIAWGTTRRRRRRGGISGRDIRTTRRTLRRIRSVAAAVSGVGAFGRRRAAHHHHPRGGVV